MPTATRHWSVILWCYPKPSEPSERVKQAQSFRAFPSQLGPTSTHFPTKSSNGDHLWAIDIHYRYLSLSPCSVPQPYTAALVYQAGEQGCGLRMGFPKSHSGHLGDWSPVLSDSNPHAVKFRSEYFNASLFLLKGLCRKKKSWIPSHDLCLLFCLGDLCQLWFKHKCRFWVSFQNASEKGRPDLWY